MTRAVVEPTISHEDARKICSEVWPDENAAREQAAKLSGGGWYVSWRFPAWPLGDSGRKIVASIHHPLTLRSADAPAGPGDVICRAES